MVYKSFFPKIITICAREKVEFDCKKDYAHVKLTDFQLVIFSKINYKILVVMSYILLALRLNFKTQIGSRKLWIICLIAIIL